MSTFFSLSDSPPHPNGSMGASSSVLLSSWLELKLNQAGTWKDLNVRYFWMLRLRTQSGWWVWAPAPWHNLSFQRCWSALSVLLWVQQHRKSKPSTLQCQLAVTSPSLAFLSCHSAFLSLGSVRHCSEAANPSWLPLPPSPGSCCCSQPWMCLCAQVSTSRPGNLACHSLVTFLGEGRAMCAVPAGNLPGFSHRYWLLGAL